MQSIHVYDDPELLAQAVADAFIAYGREALESHGEYWVALAGGTTPKAAYTLLAQPPRRSQLDWSRIRVFFGDERCVPPDDIESNFRMASQAFLDLNVPDENVYRIRGENDPADAAADYANLLISLMGMQPRFDLIMLGMGPDGHTASLFPGTDPRLDEEQLVRAVWVQEKQTHRITLTPAVINASHHVIIAAEGDGKAAMLKTVLEGPREPVRYPVQIVEPQNGTLEWFVDRDAARYLTAK